jgi:hypothetical protein
MYLPIILGSDETVVSVMSGGVKYHPVYLMLGNIHNSAKRANRNTIVPIAFLAKPQCKCKKLAIKGFTEGIKGGRSEENTHQFRKFKRQVFHHSMEFILSPLRRGMTEPVVHRCPDGHFRKAIYDLAGYIADYPEQVLVAGIRYGWDTKYVCFGGLKQQELTFK